MNKIFLQKQDLNSINEIVQENNIEKFELLYDNGNGIGYILYLEFETVINKRNAFVRIPVVTEDNW